MRINLIIVGHIEPLFSLNYLGRTVMRIACVMVLSLCLTACIGRMVGAIAHGVRIGEVLVSSYSVSQLDAKKDKFCIYPADPTVSSSDLVYIEIENLVSKALLAKGFIAAESSSDCVQAIFVGYGYGAPVTSLDPSQLARINKSSVAYSDAGKDSPIPTSKPAGLTPSRWLVLISVDVEAYKRDGSMKEIWKTVTTTPETRSVQRESLQRTVTYLLAGTMNFIGKHVPQGRRVRIRSRNDNWESLTDVRRR
jgi:hypothetical protein